MADSSATAGLRYVDPPANRNLIINGAMQVAQRGTSVTGITVPGYFTADRYNANVTSIGTWTQSVEADAPTGSGLRNSLKMLCTTADAAPSANDILLVQQRIEGQDAQRIKKGTASAEQLAVSFWVKSNVTGTYIAELNDPDNIRTVSATYSVSASATWERKTITFPADTTGALDNDNNNSLLLNFWLGSGSTFNSGTLQTTWASQTNANRAVGQTNLAASTNNYWQVTGVQLETGPVATPFEFEPYEATLRKCQRYYYRAETDSANVPFGLGQCHGTTTGVAIVPFPTTMRTQPTALEQTGTAGDYRVWTSTAGVQNLTAVPSFNSATRDLGAIGFTVASGLTAGNATGLLRTNTSAYLAWSAEL
jgi:hypothetical protein